LLYLLHLLLLMLDLNYYLLLKLLRLLHLQKMEHNFLCRLYYLEVDLLVVYFLLHLHFLQEKILNNLLHHLIPHY
jgi:hypothetical protein